MTTRKAWPRRWAIFRTIAERRGRLWSAIAFCRRRSRVYNRGRRSCPGVCATPLRFKLIDTKTNKVKDYIKDVRVLTFLSAGTWQRRDIAKSLGNGEYEVDVNVPQTGVYMVFVESASMGVRYKDLPYLMVQGVEGKQ